MWFIVDSCGITCCVITYCVILGVSGLTSKVAIAPLAEAGAISFTGAVLGYVVILTLATISHLMCVFTDPGAIPLNSDAPPILEGNDGMNVQNYCKKCGCYKPNRTHHCSTCNRCIQKMDHHCPWVNNCVGLYNQKFFLLFLFYVELGCIYSFVWLGIRSMYCVGDDKTPICNRNKAKAAEDMLLGIVAVFGAALFALFVAIMFFDQVQCIANNTTGIDALKKIKPQQRSVRDSFVEVFGTSFGISWFLPTPIKKPEYHILADS